MFSLLSNLIVGFILIISVASIGYYCYGIYAIIDFLINPQSLDPKFHPSLTILKPLCGLDSDTYDNLASFCQQDYPEYQIVFAVREKADPSVEVVNKLIKDFPNVDISIVVSDRTIGENLKVSNLDNAAALAKYEILLIADSDIRVGTDYLQRVIQPMFDPNVGVVTCLYRSLTQGWIANLEAISTSTEFHPSVLVARKLEGIKFAFGSTILIRKTTLEKIGGFLAIADYLADDFQLGYLSAQAGYKVVLSDYIVEHVLATVTLADSIKRQIRWYRGMRVSRPGGYLGLIFTYGIATSLLYLILTGGSIFAWVILCISWSTRLAMAYIVVENILKDAVAKKFLWLVPFRDLISFGLWCYSFAGNTIEWRSRRLRLTKGGKVTTIES